MQPSQHKRPTDRPCDLLDPDVDEDIAPIVSVPPAVIGVLLLLVVVLACIFYVAAQVVQTP